jgi:hypothetical protein
MDQYIKLTTALKLFEEHNILNVIDMELNSYGNVEFECAFSSYENSFYDIKGVIIDNTIIERTIIIDEKGNNTYQMRIIQDTRNMSVNYDSLEQLEQKFNNSSFSFWLIPVRL